MNARGMAQLIVLWALLLLGALALSFSFSMRTEALAARNGFDSERAYFQARTGINRTIALLSSRPPDNVLGIRIEGGDDDASYEVRLESESGKIDINFVQDGVLKEVLRNGGLPADEAEAVGDAILDWRDQDDRPRDRGAEEPDYVALPEPVKPRNGKLGSVEELRYVKGVRPAVFRGLLARVFTVHGRSAQVNVNAAPADVLRVLPGFTPELAARVVSRREESPFRSPAELASVFGAGAAPGGALALLSVFPGSNVYTITAVAKGGGRVTRIVRCAVGVGGGGSRPVRILRWEDRVADESASP